MSTGGMQLDAILVAYRVLEGNLRVRFLRERYFVRENVHAHAMFMRMQWLDSVYHYSEEVGFCRSYPFALCISVSCFTLHGSRAPSVGRKDDGSGTNC